MDAPSRLALRICLGAALLLKARCRASALTNEERIMKTCIEAINSFQFGLYEGTDDNGQPIISKHDPKDNATVEFEWRRYQQCIRHVRRDPFTHREYLEKLPPMSTIALGQHYPVVLTPAKPDMARYFLLPAMDFVVGSFVKYYGSYDVNEEQVLRSLVDAGECVVELGANIGSYTVVLADQVHDSAVPGGGKGIVYAIEPFRKIFQILNANLALHGFGNVVTRNIGMGSKREFIEVKAPDLNDYTNLGAARVFFQQDEEIARVPFEGTEEIEVDNLDNLDFIRCPEINFLKIDTEGMEEAVIGGGLRRLQKDWPLIYVESQPYFQDNDDRFLQKMQEWGYSCSPIRQLEMHELLLCVPFEKMEHYRAKLRRGVLR